MKFSNKLKKTITWTTFATSVSSAVLYFSTGVFVVVPVVILTSVVVMPIAYYCHEKVWERYDRKNPRKRQ